MDHNDVQDLEDACERALTDVLRKQYPHRVEVHISHLMAKAAVAVLEAVEKTQPEEQPRGSKKPIRWQINPDVVARVKAFYEQQLASPVVKRRASRNLADEKSPVTKDEFWKWMVACRLTTKQKSGPKSHVCNFIRKPHFPLAYALCNGRPDLAKYAEDELASGQLSYRKRIAKDIVANMAYLESGGWEPVFEHLEMVRLNSSPSSERRAADLLDENLKGFGPKQSRNLLQCLGLSKFEVPLDSRTGKWLVKRGFRDLKIGKLQNRKYYNEISDHYQRLCKACDIEPCVLDAAIFASFDKDDWTEENLVW